MSIDSSSGKGRYGDLARLLRSRRAELGMSRRDLTAATGLSYPYVSQLEGGYRAPSLSSARNLADALHLPVEELVRAGSETPDGPEAAREGEARGEFLRNPRYAAGIEASSVASAPPPLAEAPPPHGAGRTEREDGPVGWVAEEVADLVGRLPATDRLEALSRAQTRVMEGLVAEEVRRAEVKRSGPGRAPADAFPRNDGSDTSGRPPKKRRGQGRVR